MTAKSVPWTARGGISLSSVDPLLVAPCGLQGLIWTTGADHAAAFREGFPASGPADPEGPIYGSTVRCSRVRRCLFGTGAGPKRRLRGVGLFLSVRLPGSRQAGDPKTVIAPG